MQRRRTRNKEVVGISWTIDYNFRKVSAIQRWSKWTNWEKGLTSFNPINLFQMLVVEEEEEEEVEGEEGEGEGEEDDEGGDA